MTSIASDLRQILVATPRTNILKAAATFFLGLCADLNRYSDAAHKVHGGTSPPNGAISPWRMG